MNDGIAATIAAVLNIKKILMILGDAASSAKSSVEKMWRYSKHLDSMISL